jgi:PAS domain S-box-containing protein
MVLSREVTARIKEVLEKHPEGLSITDLVRSVDVNRNTAGRYLENLLLSGQVEMRRFGMAKMYTLAKRLPVSSVLSISSEMVMQLDSGQRVIYANDPLLTFLGAPEKDLFGKNIEFSRFSIVFEEVFSELIERFRWGLKGEEWRGELSRPVQGKFFFCRVTPTVSNEGKKGVSVIFEDISDQKRDEERIRKSEARLRSIFTASPVGIGVVADRILLEVNNRLCQMTGYTGGQLVGKSARILYTTREEFDRIETLIYNQVQQSGTGPVETRWVKKDKTVIDILLSSTPLDPANISGGITFTALDVTERNRAERALRESEDRYRKLVEISPNAVILHRDGKTIYVNPAAVRLAGASCSDNLIGRPILDIVAPEYHDSVRTNITRDLAGEATPPMVLRILRVDKKPVMVEGRGVSTFIDGSPAVLVALNDITERYQAGLALKKSEERYRSVFQNTGAATCIVEENTIISLANAEFERLSGYTRREIEMKKSWTEFVVKEDLEQMLARHYLRREGGDAPRQYEFGFIEKTGEIRRILITIDLIPGTTQSVASLLDITDRRLADEQLLQREQQYRFIADNSLDIINRQTPECICTYVSPSITPLLGYSEMEVLGKPVLAMVHPDDLEGVRRDMMAIVQDGSSHVTSTFRFRHKDGSYLWFESTTKIIRDEKTGQIREFLSISRDITARKRSEKEATGI